MTMDLDVDALESLWYDKAHSDPEWRAAVLDRWVPAVIAEVRRLHEALATLGPRPHSCSLAWGPGAPICTCGAVEHNAKVSAALAATKGGTT